MRSSGKECGGISDSSGDEPAALTNQTDKSRGAR